MTKKKEVTKKTTAVAKTKKKAPAKSKGEMIAALNEYSEEQINLLKRTICKGSTNDELILFIGQCKRIQLDPFQRQVHAVKRWDSNERREVMAIQISIDGFRLIAERSGKYAGQKAIEWCGSDGKWVDVWLSEENPVAARATILKHDFKEPLIAVAHFREYAATKKDGTLTRMWATKGPLMIGKCAESLGLRKAFPNDLSGLYSDDEMSNADNVIDGEVVDAVEAPTIEVVQEKIEAPAESVVEKVVETKAKEMSKEIDENPCDFCGGTGNNKNVDDGECGPCGGTGTKPPDCLAPAQPAPEPEKKEEASKPSDSMRKKIMALWNELAKLHGWDVKKTKGIRHATAKKVIGVESVNDMTFDQAKLFMEKSEGAIEKKKDQDAAASQEIEVIAEEFGGEVIK